MMEHGNGTIVGISDIALYLPRPEMSMEALLAERERTHPEIRRHLSRAVSSTGQKSMRFPELWEDAATMAAEAVSSLITRHPGRWLSSLRYLSVGTETGVDHSKPVAAYVEGMLQRAGRQVPESITTFQIQHACAGGTISLMSVGALLNLGNGRGDTGVVVCSDIARYDRGTTAEITQGAGAVALLVETSPKLLELDLSTQGYSSRDVDDFFRPLGSQAARVRGAYSLQCYQDSLDAAFLDFCRRSDREPADVLRETDMFVLHSPYHSLPGRALMRLLSDHLGLSAQEAEAFLAERGFPASTAPVAKAGNIYTGSLYLALAFLLAEREQTLGDDLIGRSVLIFSYGSGNTGMVIEGRVAAGARDVIRSWDLASVLSSGLQADIDAYERWMEAPYPREEYQSLMGNGVSVPEGAFYLSSIREDGYREYSLR